MEFLERKCEELGADGVSRCRDRDLRAYSDALKQLERRGKNERFVSHGRRFKAQDEML